MNKTLKVLVPLAAASAALPMAMVMMSPAQAATGQTYSTTLRALNNSGGAGTLTVTLKGDQATVKESWSGLAAKFMDGPYPHVQHFHIEGKGQCPLPSADKNKDGIVDTVEGQPAYGKIGTTISTKGATGADQGTNLKVAPGGSSLNLNRTFTMNPETVKSIKAGQAVVVVHGLGPDKVSKTTLAKKSNLVPSLPLIATTPALCGVVSAMPTGGPNTGAGSTSEPQNIALLGLSGGLMVAAAGMYVVGKRREQAAV